MKLETEQLQKSWLAHEFYTMIPLSELKAKCAVHVESKEGSIEASDPQNITMKRIVQNKSEEMKGAILKMKDSFKPFEHHVYSVLQN